MALGLSLSERPDGNISTASDCCTPKPIVAKLQFSPNTRALYDSPVRAIALVKEKGELNFLDKYFQREVAAKITASQRGKTWNPIWRKWRSVVSASLRRNSCITTKLVQSVKE